MPGLQREPPLATKDAAKAHPLEILTKDERRAIGPFRALVSDFLLGSAVGWRGRAVATRPKQTPASRDPKLPKGARRLCVVLEAPTRRRTLLWTRHLHRRRLALSERVESVAPTVAVRRNQTGRVRGRRGRHRRRGRWHGWGGRRRRRGWHDLLVNLDRGDVEARVLSQDRILPLVHHVGGAAVAARRLDGEAALARAISPLKLLLLGLRIHPRITGLVPVRAATEGVAGPVAAQASVPRTVGTGSGRRARAKPRVRVGPCAHVQDKDLGIE